MPRLDKNLLDAQCSMHQANVQSDEAVDLERLFMALCTMAYDHRISWELSIHHGCLVHVY